MRPALAFAFVGLLVSCQTPVAPVVTSPPPAATSPARPLTSTPAPTLTGWGEREPLPTPRSEVAAVAFANATIYVVGGFGGGRVVERYVVLSRAWDRQPDMPVALDHPMAAAVVGGSRQGIFVMGGNADGRSSARVFRLGIGAPAWQEVAPMPFPRAAGAAVAIGRTIYVVGGAVDGRTLSNSLYLYDVEADKWSVGPDIPTPRDHLAAVALGSVVCAVGGRRLDMSRNLGALECYDPSTNAWRRHADMPTPRGGLGAAAVGNKIVAVGGEQPSGTFKEVEVYDAATNSWSRGQELPHPRHGLGVVAIDRVIYAIAGGPTPGGSQTGIVEYWNLP